MKKAFTQKAFSAVLAVLMLFGTLQALSLTAFAADKSDLTFALSSDGLSYEVSACDKNAAGALLVPGEYNGKPVTAIRIYAFSGCTKLTSVTLSDGIKTIGGGAFWGCTQLVDVTFPDSVVTMESSVFCGCMSLLNIRFPSNADINLMSFFKGCTSLKSVEIPKGCTFKNSINYYVFEECTSLERVSISELYLGPKIFYNCKNLKSVECDGIIRSDGDNTNPPSYAFYNCESLESIDISGFEYSICDYMFYNCKSLKSISIPSAVKYIGKYAFAGCESLSELNIPDSVESFGDGAFNNCTGFLKINLGSNIKSVSVSDFSGCTSLEQVNVANGNKNYSSKDGVLFNKDKTTLLFYPRNKSGDYVVPSGVKTVGERAFAGVKGLEKVELPEGVTTVGERAFFESGVKTAILPKSLESISESAFKMGNLHDIYYAGTKEEWNALIGGKYYKWLGDVTVHFKDVTPPQVKAEASNRFSTVQTVSVKLSDNEGVAGYYWGTSERYSDNPFTSNGGSTASLLVNSPGKYYLTAEDLSGNISETLALEFVKLTFDLCGGSADYSFAVAKKGNSLTPPVPAKQGYTFKGWAKNKSAANGSTSVAANETATYYAVWQVNTYTVSYNANGGLSAPAAQTKTHGKDLVLSGAKPERKGYVFVGWSKSPEVTDAEYMPGGKFSDNANATLYAVWEKEITVIYGDINGDGKINTVDLAMLRKYLANRNPATGESSVSVGAGADVNGDGKINTVDLAMLRKHLADRDPVTGESSVILGPKK